jgi:LDH2 family malate/lactate/ureidoglycolate dehydrogenase
MKLTRSADTERSDPGPIPAPVVIEFTVALLGRLGVPEKLAAEVAEALVAADLEGVPSHGLMLLPMYVERLAAGSVSPTSEGRIVSDRAGAVVFDAEHGLGQVTARRAVAIAIERARQHALAAVAVRNAFHFGTAGRWAAMMAHEGCVGMALTNTRPLMPPPGGAERLVGNNPVAIAVPSLNDEPFIVDFALSAAAMGRIRLADAAGERIPEGWACDADGVPTTDPAAAIAGMLLPVGGPKGFGLAMMVDLLAGGLSTGAVGHEVRPLYGDASLPYACSQFFLAIDIGAFRPADEYAAVTRAFAERVRTSRPALGSRQVMAPGDPAILARRAADSQVSFDAATLTALRIAAEKHEVAFSLAP